jgi:hypothetical protein
MAQSYNYDEIVTLLGNRQGDAWADSTQVTLARAVKVVMEEWELREQATVMILREGSPITKLDEVRAIYARNDFPLPRNDADG